MGLGSSRALINIPVEQLGLPGCDLKVHFNDEVTHQSQTEMSNAATVVVCFVFFSLQDANQVKVAQENGAVFVGGAELIQPVSCSCECSPMQLQHKSLKGQFYSQSVCYLQ